MPLFDIKVKASLEGATQISLGSDYSLRVKFTCGSCREASDKFSVFTWEDEVEVPGGKGTANLTQSCKNCKAPCSVSIMSKRSDAVYTAEEAEAGKSKTIATIECRGVTPCDAECGPGWVVTGPSGIKWDDVSLDEEFAEFDEGADASITVLDAVMSVAPAGKK